MIKKIAVIPGDGVGPEIMQQSVKVLDAVAEKFGHEFIYSYGLIGGAAIDQTGDACPDETMAVCSTSDAIFLGTIGDTGYNDSSAKLFADQGLLKLRKSLQLFANILPITTYTSLRHLSPLKSKHIEQVDFLIFRELTGGNYFGEKEINADQSQAYDGSEYTKEEIARIAHLAFRAAQQRRKKLTLVDSVNMPKTSMLRRKVVKDLAPQYKDVSVGFLHADEAAMQMILNPRQFDVILTEDLIGSIINGAAGAMTGSMGLLPSASLGNERALFGPNHGTYPHAAGKDIANPLGAILSAAMMLDHFNLKEEAGIVRDGVAWTISHLFVTKDIDPVNFYFTSTVGELICDYVSGRISGDINQENIELRKSTII